MGAAFAAYLEPLRKAEWVVYAKEPFGGPEAVLAYLSRYTHRVAISNHRLVEADQSGVTFRYKDYRIDGPGRYKTMTLPTHEFIRRFLMHVLPKRLPSHPPLRPVRQRQPRRQPGPRSRAAPRGAPRDGIARPWRRADAGEPRAEPRPCPCCGGRMLVIEIFARGCEPKHRPQRAPPLGPRAIS